MNHKIIEIFDTFKYSCNVKTDYLDESRINAFLPNYELVEHLKGMITDITAKNSTKSILISGAYGTGKSYLISILCSILSQNTLNLKTLMKKIGQVTISEKIISDNISNSNYLIVFPRDNFKSFKQSITQGMLDAIKDNNLDIKLNYIYELIIEKIEQWKIHFPYFYELLEKTVSDIPELKEKLKNHDETALSYFREIYPTIMAGDSLPLISDTVSFTKNLEEFERNITKSGYDGVIYIFDEFGRYLESNLNSVDVKEVQDIAEYCNRTQSKSSLILSTHKGLFQYSDSTSEYDDIVEWEKVSGRFKQIHLHNDVENISNIVNTIVHKTDYYDNFIKDNNRDYEIYQDRFLNLQTTEGPEILDNLYPLNYVTGKLLPLITTKLGQNDRTLYTFLCSDQKMSLKDEYSKLKDGFQTVTPDKLFDYFAENFENLGLRNYEYKIYNTARNHLRTIKINNQSIIVKILALFNIIDTKKDLIPKDNILKLASNLDDQTYQSTIKNLIEKRIIIFRRHTELYELATDLTYNIDKDVDDCINKTNVSKIELKKLLSDIVPIKYIYPQKYNQEHQINRFIRTFYIFDYDMANFSPCQNSDFNLIYLIRTNLKSRIDYKLPDNTILISNKKKVLDLSPLLKEITAINNVSTYPIYLENKNAKLELDRYKFESINKIRLLIKSYFNYQEQIYALPDNKRLKNESTFQEILTKQLLIKYPKFVDLNYELINLNKLSVPIKTARSRILDRILTLDFDEKYFYKTGAENSIARITLANTKTINFDSLALINLKESNFSSTFSDLKIDITNGKYGFDEIYEKYTTVNGDYGFRKGLFTILLTIFIKYYEKNLFITQKQGIVSEEIEISSEVINNIEDFPENYEIHYYKFDNDVDSFFKSIRSFLINYIDDSLFQHDPAKASIKALTQFLYDRSDLLYSFYGWSYVSKHEVIQFIERVSERTPKQFWFKIMPEFFAESSLLYIKDKIIDRLQEILDAEHSLIENIKSLIITELNKNLKEVNIDDKNLLDILINYKYNNDHINMILQEKLTNKDTWLQSFTEYLVGYSYKKWVNLNQKDRFLDKLQILLGSPKQGKKINVSSQNNGLSKVLKSKIHSQLVNFGTALSKEDKIEILKQLIKEIK